MSDAAENPGYYAIIPAAVRYDKRVPPAARLLYGELTALSNKEGFCWASNNYFAELYDCTPQAISRWIKALAEAGHIVVEYVRREDSPVVESRKISINKNTLSINCSGGINKLLRGYQQNVKGNNTSNNIFNNTAPKPEKPLQPTQEKRFQRPTPEEVKAYCDERKNGIDPQVFVDYYEARDWRTGNSRIKDWKACVRTWEAHERKRNEGRPAPAPRPEPEKMPELSALDLDAREQIMRKYYNKE